MNFEVATVLAGGICTLAIFSFLIKENGFYRFFEHFFIGISAGLGVVYALKNFLWPLVLVPMLGLDIFMFPDGTTSKPHNPMYFLYLLPMAFGLLYYCIYSKRYAWLAKLVIGFSLGAGGGLAFKGFFNEMLPQFASSFKPLVVFDETRNILFLESFNNIAFVFTLLAVMYYFFFTFRRAETGVRGAVSSGVNISGRFLMMVCFGAFFGSTVMARLALLVERLQFLLFDWMDALRVMVSL